MNVQNPLLIKEFTPWHGAFEEAKAQHEAGNQKFKHLDTECTICFSDFLPSDELVVLSCSHGLHKDCFASWEKKVCPIDETPITGIEKIIFLSNELFIPSKLRRCWQFSTPQGQADLHDVSKSWQKAQAEGVHADLNHAEQFQANVKLAIQALQNFLNLFEGTLTGSTLVAAAKNDAKNFFSYLSSAESVAILGENLTAIATDCIHDLTHFLPEETSCGPSPHTVFIVDGIFYKLTKWSLKLVYNLEPHLIDIQAGYDMNFRGFAQKDRERVNLYFCTLAHELIEPLQIIKKEGDRIFFQKQFKAIRGLSSDKDKKAYLESLDLFSLGGESSFKRLKRLTQGGGPTSRAIQRQINRIEQNRICLCFAMIAGLLACVQMTFYSKK